MLHAHENLKMLLSLKKLQIFQEKYLFYNNLSFSLAINKYLKHSDWFFDMMFWDISYVMH